MDRSTGGSPLKVGLNSPWALLLHGETLYIAMAGHHQIWALDLKGNRLTPYAGNGREDLKNDTLSRSEFAQPSGLCQGGKTLYVADSETSSIRAVPITGRGEVKTIVGEGLLEYVGPLVETRVQEKPLSIALREIRERMLTAEPTEG